MVRNTLRSACAITILAVALGGCANQNSIFRKNIVRPGANPTVFTVDAKQRHLIVAPDADQKTWRTCAEAAPDVFSALSTSAGADLGFGQSGTQTDARAKAALAIAEAAGTIERTQTINLLRESMYRTCERYLSGAITPAAFAVQAGRDWRAMIGILAIEQLTRAARPPSTIIAAGSTSASVQSESDVIRELQIAYVAEDEARIAKTNADTDVTRVCANTAAENKPACDAKKQIAATAGDALARATQKRETWASVANSYKGISSASTGAATNNAGGYQTPATTTSDMSTVATTVGNIVKWAFGTDETQLFCIQSIQQGLDPTGKLRDTCLTYLVSKVKAEQSLFASPAVTVRAGEIGDLIQVTREKVARYLERLDDATYASERTLIASEVGSFCEGKSRLHCIADVRNGATDHIPEQFSAAIDRRIQARGNP